MSNVSDFELFLMPLGHEMHERKKNSSFSFKSWSVQITTNEETNSERKAFAEEEN